MARKNQQQAPSGFPGGSFNPVPSAGFFKGAPAGLFNIDKFDPQQQGYLNSLLQMIQQGTGNLNLPGQQTQASQMNFGPISQDAQRQFMQNTVPSIAERFSSMGSGGALSSPDLMRQLSGAGADLQSQLASMGSQYGLQQAGLGLQEQGLQGTNLMNLLQMYLQPRQDSMYAPSQSSGLATMARGGVQAAGALLPYMI